jgi:hypothetical protein
MSDRTGDGDPASGTSAEEGNGVHHGETVLNALCVHCMVAAYPLRSLLNVDTERCLRRRGLLSYAGDIAEAYRLTGNYTGRVLRGEQLAGLPMQRGLMYINLKTAKALGITCRSRYKIAPTR